MNIIAYAGDLLVISLFLLGQLLTEFWLWMMGSIIVICAAIYAFMSTSYTSRRRILYHGLAVATIGPIVPVSIWWLHGASSVNDAFANLHWLISWNLTADILTCSFTLAGLSVGLLYYRVRYPHRNRDAAQSS